VEATPAAVDPKVAAECVLYEEAMMRMAAPDGVPNTQIVIGCPGYENVRDTTNRFQGAGQFLNASSAKVPQNALDKGKMGKNLYQKMLARGVSEKVANQMVETVVFDAAIAAFGG